MRSYGKINKIFYEKILLSLSLQDFILKNKFYSILKNGSSQTEN